MHTISEETRRQAVLALHPRLSAAQTMIEHDAEYPGDSTPEQTAAHVARRDALIAAIKELGGATAFVEARMAKMTADAV